MTHDELESQWKLRLEEAKRRAILAIIQCEEAKAHVKNEKTAADTFTSDYRKAREAEAAALAEYSQTLRVYLDLVAHGKLPPENETRPPIRY